jgi:hypothetical protein
VFLVDGGPLLLEDDGPVFFEDGGPLLRGNFHGTQWIQDDRGVSECELGSGKGSGSSSIISCNNDDRFTF